MIQIILYLLFLMALYGSASAMSDSSFVRQELRSWGEGKWAVVSVREVTGTVVVVSSVVGREIDLEACNRFGLFQGETVFGRKWELAPFTLPVAGFQSAVFLKLKDGHYGVMVVYRNDLGLQHRLLSIPDRATLERLRDYLSWMSETSATSGGIEALDETVTFSTVVPKFTSGRRLKGALMLADGDQVKGQILPVIDDGRLFVETETGFRRIPIGTVSQVSIGGSGGRGIVRETILGGIHWAFVGGVTGVMAGVFYEGVSAKEEMLYGAMVGGVVGGAFGFLNGVFDLRPAKTFVLDTPRSQPARKIEVAPTQIRFRF